MFCIRFERICRLGSFTCSWCLWVKKPNIAVRLCCSTIVHKLYLINLFVWLQFKHNVCVLHTISDVFCTYTCFQYLQFAQWMQKTWTTHQTNVLLSSFWIVQLYFWSLSLNWQILATDGGRCGSIWWEGNARSMSECKYPIKLCLNVNLHTKTLHAVYLTWRFIYLATHWNF